MGGMESWPQCCMALGLGACSDDPQGTKSFTDQEREAIYRDATLLALSLVIYILC